MTRFNRILAGIFTLQIIVAVGIYVGSQQPSADQIQTALLTVEQKQINRIVIDDGKGKQTVLSQQDGHWQLPEYYNLPADQGKVEQALATLGSTKSGWPVATTASSRERFEVSDDHYQTRVTLANGDTDLETLYLGTSPGFRQLHLRRSGDDDVYAVKLNNYDFPAANDKWLDKTLLQPKGEIAELQGPDFDVAKQGDDWKLAGDTGEVVKDEVEKLVNTLAHLSVQGAAEKTADKANYELTLKAAGDTIHYRFFSDGGNYYAKRDNDNQAFKISKSDYEKITGETATQLVKHGDNVSDSADDKQHASANIEAVKKAGQQG